MDVYPSAVEKQMQRFYQSLNERDRRRYVAVEAVRLKQGGQSYVVPLAGHLHPTPDPAPNQSVSGAAHRGFPWQVMDSWG